MKLRVLTAAMAVVAISLGGCANIGKVNGHHVNGYRIADASGTPGPPSRERFCKRNTWLCVIGGAALAGGVGYGLSELFGNDNNGGGAIPEPINDPGPGED